MDFQRHRGGGTLIAALVLAPLALRPQLTAVGPLLPQIQRELSLSHTTAGLLGTIPVVAMGVFSLPAPAVVARIGSRATFAAALALISLSGLSRALVPGAAAVLALTVVFGIAAGVGGAVLPIVVKERFADRPAFATGGYSIGINLGAALATAVAVPIADALGGWRAALGALAMAAAFLSVIWLVLTSGALPPREPSLRAPRLPWRSGTVWLLAIIFGLQATCFHGLSIWLADAYVENGWRSSQAGALVGVFQVASVPGTLLVLWSADRVVPRRLYLIASATVLTVSLALLEGAPALAWLAAVLAGLACGSLFPLALTLSVDVARDATDAAGIAALMLGVGYAIAGLAPVLLGVARDAAGSFSTGLWLLTAVAALLTIFTLAMSPARLRAQPLTAP